MATELNVYKTALTHSDKLHKEYSDLRDKRQLLNGQLSENEVVQAELDFLDDNDEIFKLTGPVLVKQSLAEAKLNVTKRIEYIKSEIQRVTSAMSETEKKLKDARERLCVLQESALKKKAAQQS